MIPLLLALSLFAWQRPAANESAKQFLEEQGLSASGLAVLVIQNGEPILKFGAESN